MFENVIADIKAYNSKLMGSGLLKRIIFFCFAQELYPVLIYRFGRWANHQCRLPVLRQVMGAIYFILWQISEILFHVYISPEYEIGPGLRLEHFGYRGIVARIGKNCRVQQLVVMGHVGAFRGGGVPTLGDNVYVGVGAKILGDIKVGDNAIIAANAVVTKDVPANAVVGGVPAKVIKIRSDSVYEDRFF